MGGEKVLDGAKDFIKVGSPPRGRGKAIAVSLFLRFGRITPAWAGKSHNFKFFGLYRMDHPRVGGEKVVGLHKRNLSQGSPPRGRGKGTRLRYPWPLDRITPAWAGKRVSVCWAVAVCWDHPRMGGEKLLVIFIGQ